MIDILTGIGATKTGLDLIKAVRELLRRDKIDPAEIQDKLGALQDALYQAREALGDAQELNRMLTRQIEDNKRLADIDADMEYISDGGFYIRRSEKAAGKFIPYCPVCWKKDSKTVPLNPMYGEGYYQCDVHKSNYETAASRRRSGFGGSGSPSFLDDM